MEHGPFPEAVPARKVTVVGSELVESYTVRLLAGVVAAPMLKETFRQTSALQPLSEALDLPLSW